MSNTNKVYASGMKGKPKKPEKKVVTIDITELYNELKETADNEVRTVEEQCKYLIKQGLKSSTVNTSNITYILPSTNDGTYNAPFNDRYRWTCSGGRQRGVSIDHTANPCGGDVGGAVAMAYASDDGVFETESTIKV